MRQRRIDFAWVALSAFVAACGSTQTPRTTAPTPEQVPTLQREFARDSSNRELRIRLAEALRRGGQPAPAARLLEPVAPSDPTAAFYLALVREDQGRASEARQLYEQYLARGTNRELRDRVRDRLTWLGRLELQEAVRSALSRERELASRAPEPRTVGVFPFLTATEDPQLRPLGVAFAELISNDLAQTERLRVVERARVQQLLDEIKLAEARRVDPASAARSGRLLGAATLVQGRIDGPGTNLAFQTAVVRVQTAAPVGNPLRERDALARLFDVEKKLALGVYDRLGIQLTSAERDRVSRQQTRNVQALLELGLGLEAQDAGRFPEAAGHFQRAVQLDPAFQLAQQHLAQATIEARASEVSALSLSTLALGDFSGGVSRPVDVFRAIERLVPDPSVRDPSVEALGTEGIARRGTVDIVIRRPAP